MLRSHLPRLGDRIPIGALPSVSPFCFGYTTDHRSVSEAFEAGINFFFVTTDMHWPLYDASRRGLADLLQRPGVRDQIVVAGVCYCTQPEFCRLPFAELVSAVPRLERLDVLIAGGAYGRELPLRLPVYREHRERRHTGARAIGASFHDRAAVADVAADLDLALVRYNANHPGAREDLFPHLPPVRPKIFNFSSTQGYVAESVLRASGIGDEVWIPEITDHYRFALSRPEIDGLLVSLSGAGEIRALAEALDEAPLDEEEQEHLLLLAEIGNGRAALR